MSDRFAAHADEIAFIPAPLDAEDALEVAAILRRKVEDGEISEEDALDAAAKLAPEKEGEA